MNSIEPMPLIILAVALSAVLTVLALDLLRRTADGTGLANFALEGRAAAVLQILLGALVLASLFGAVPVQVPLLAAAAWGLAIALGQCLALADIGRRGHRA